MWTDRQGNGIIKEKREMDDMRERIETIPVNEAFDSGDECPFCHLEREVEQRVIRYVLGPGAS